MSIVVEGPQSIKIEDVVAAVMKFNNYDMEIKVGTDRGDVVIELSPKWGTVRELARQIYDEIDGQFGFSEEDEETEAVE